MRHHLNYALSCLLYTSDAADERSSVDLGGRRIIKQKKQNKKAKKKKKNNNNKSHGNTPIDTRCLQELRCHKLSRKKT